MALSLLAGLVPALAQDVTIETTLDPAEPAAPRVAPAQSQQQQLYCRQLERQLPVGWQQNLNGQVSLQNIQAQAARASQQFRRAEAQAEAADCFDYFLFSKSWRDSPQCRQIRQGMEGARQTLAQLEQQRQSAGASQERMFRLEALLAELARSRCGPQYAAAVQHRPDAIGNGGGWSEGDAFGTPGAQNGADWSSRFPVQPGNSFRTICVRMCDGYYFPINFATTPEQFPADEQACQRQCGTPARLYYYPNPGGEVEQAMALDGSPYSSLTNAFRYRKELVKTCSCRTNQGGDLMAGTAPGETTGSTDGGWGATAAGGDPEAGTLPDADLSQDPLFELPAKPAKKVKKAAVPAPAPSPEAIPVEP